MELLGIKCIFNFSKRKKKTEEEASPILTINGAEKWNRIIGIEVKQFVRD